VTYIPKDLVGKFELFLLLQSLLPFNGSRNPTIFIYFTIGDFFQVLRFLKWVFCLCLLKEALVLELLDLALECLEEETLALWL
jgi:hypothetical protein